MGTVIGAVEMTLGSEDPIELQLLKDDGVTPIGSLTGITELTLFFIDEAGEIKVITGARLVVSNADLSKVKLSPLAADFPEVQRYDYKVKFKDASGTPKQKFVPDGGLWYTWQVFPLLPS